MRTVRIAAALFGAALLAGPAPAQNGCTNAPAGVDCGDPMPQLFPASHPWNAKVKDAPVDGNSANIIAWIGPTKAAHPDFGGDDGSPNGIYGLTYFSARRTGPTAIPLEPVAFDYPLEADSGGPGQPAGYPIPVAAKQFNKWIEGGEPGHPPVGGDKHMLIVDPDNQILYELFGLRCEGATSASCAWNAGSGATWKLDGSTSRPFGWTSGDAAGMAILPGLVRYQELYSGNPITHAFRVTMIGVNGFVHPASHNATTNSEPNAPPLGARLRLKPSYALPSYPAGAPPASANRGAIDRFLQALKDYGLIVVDTSGSLGLTKLPITGAYDNRWDVGDLLGDVWHPVFSQLHTSDFEVIQLGWGAGKFHPVTPCRLLDTRLANGPLGGPAIGANAERTFAAATADTEDGTLICGLPKSVRSISGNLTVAGPTASGTVKLIAAGLPTSAPPTAMSYTTGKTRANNFIAKLSGRLATPNPDTPWGSFVIRNEGAQPLHVIVDVNGYFE